MWFYKKKDVSDPKKTVNFLMLNKGLAKIDRSIDLTENLKFWEDEEETLVKKKIGIFGTHELSEDEDDENWEKYKSWQQLL